MTVGGEKRGGGRGGGGGGSGGGKGVARGRLGGRRERRGGTPTHVADSSSPATDRAYCCQPIDLFNGQTSTNRS